MSGVIVEADCCQQQTPHSEIRLYSSLYEYICINIRNHLQWYLDFITEELANMRSYYLRNLNFISYLIHIYTTLTPQIKGKSQCINLTSHT